MTKQEEIREGISEWLEEYCPKHNATSSGWAIIPEVAKERYREDANEILSYLHSQDIVIKVEKELPNIQRSVDNAYLIAQLDMLDAGYVAVEPLIEEINIL